ncbi:MAG: hypothetical protein JNL98_27415 [Bryobacterales bacterium]|nr:hypothetical protein [Bryobacterales bacterium]
MLVLIQLVCLQIASLAGAVSVQLVTAPGERLVIEIRGVDAALHSKAASQLKVVVEGVESAPPMAGSVSVTGGALRFEPRYALQAGVSYRVEWPGVLNGVVAVPKRVLAAVATVEHVYPSAAELPANLLKFYVHFSEPMSRGEAWKRLHLMDDKGVEVPLPFLEIEEELWDREGRRLTVLFDPGRIKRGLVPHNEAGPAMTAGRSYEFVIDAEWLSAKGAPMARGHRRRFRVVEEDRTPLTLSNWRLTVPAASSRDALRVEFPEPVDRALAERLIWVETEPGQRVEGAVTIGPEERVWSFAPEQPWMGGDYVLRVAATIEDLAGNRLDRRFDVDTFDKVEMRLTESTKTVRFKVRN